jgi:alpha-glucosidase (family GH31 glycosyl hydrolase)
MSAGGCANSKPENCGNVRPFGQPLEFDDINRHTLMWRSRMTPFFYNVARYVYDHGYGLLSPMYYRNPASPEAYLAARNGSYAQFFHRDEWCTVMVAPVVVPAGADGLSTVTFWLPGGTLW